MRSMTRRTWLVGAVSIALAAALGCAGLTGCSAPADQGQEAEPAAEQPQTRTITDMAGRTVEVPAKVESVATFGAVGVLNAFVECMGQGDLIANEMPDRFAKNESWQMQYKFAPQLSEGPVLETADGVDIEATLQLNPDLCITMMEDIAQQLEENGMTVIVLQWGDVEDVKTAVSLMGEVLGAEERAAQYVQYFDDTVAKAEALTADLPESERVTAIYGDVTSLTNPHIISEWWLEAAGGVSVTKEAHTKNTLEYTREELLAWQPQVIFSNNKKLEDIYADANLASLPAIQNQRVYAVPTVAHTWGNRTVEQPLTVLWALSKMYPDRYSEAELTEDIKQFYQTFFEYEMTDADIDRILNYA